MVWLGFVFNLLGIVLGIFFFLNILFGHQILTLCMVYGIMMIVCGVGWGVGCVWGCGVCVCVCFQIKLILIPL